MPALHAIPKSTVANTTAICVQPLVKHFRLLHLHQYEALNAPLGAFPILIAAACISGRVPVATGPGAMTPKKPHSPSGTS